MKERQLNYCPKKEFGGKIDPFPESHLIQTVQAFEEKHIAHAPLQAFSDAVGELQIALLNCSKNKLVSLKSIFLCFYSYLPLNSSIIAVLANL